MDCESHYEPCPFGCGFFVNKNVDLSTLKKEIEKFSKNCSSCKNDCGTPPTKENIECKKDGKCGVKDSNDTQKNDQQEEVNIETSDNWINSFDAHIVDSQLLEHELFERVFPEVKFFVQTSEITMPRSKRIIAEFDGMTYNMPSQFNDLFEKIIDSSEATIKDRVQLFALFAFRFEENITSCEEIPPRKFRNTYLFNYEVVGQGNKLLFSFYHNKIFRVEQFINNKHTGPILLHVPQHSIHEGIPEIIDTDQ